MCMVLALWLVPAGTAVAKEPVAAKVCGKSDCRTVKDRHVLMALTEGGPPTDPPDRAAPWYTVRTTIAIGEGQRDHFMSAIVPSTGLTRGSDAVEGYVWMPSTPRAKAAYRRVTRGLAPFPADTLKGVGATTVRLVNLATGRTVRIRALRYDSTTKTVTLDPYYRMSARTRYRVVIRAGIRDLVGNPLMTQTWTFRTGRS